MTEVLSANIIDFNPEVSDYIFQESLQSNFWVGKVAVGDVVCEPDYYDALTRLRGRVYTSLGFIDRDDLDSEGRDIDADDKRSVNFAVLENQLNDPGTARVVGSGRLICKDQIDLPLPIEKFFPEIFQDEPLSSSSVEISRLISRHPDNMTQHLVGLSVMRALTRYGLDTGKTMSYCIIEKPLLKLLKYIGIPVEPMGPAKDVPEYGGILYPVRLNPFEIDGSVTRDKSGSVLLRQFFDDGDNRGQGYYPSNLMIAQRENDE